MPAIDEFSLTTVPIDLYFNEQLLSKGTAFTWERDNKHYLITNWHNVSGRDPNTDKHLSSSTAAEPNVLHGMFNTKGPNIGHKHPLRMYIRQDSGEVGWLVHPTHKRGIDVVAIPLGGELVSSIRFYPINKMGSSDLLVRIGMDVFVLGYPFGTGNGLPVWKRGSIASEPDLVPHPDKYLLVDTASRPGMSGSPVILRTYFIHVTQENEITATPGAANKFIGVYSGRLRTQNPLDAQIGMVWSDTFIDEIIDGGLRDYG